MRGFAQTPARVQNGRVTGKLIPLPEYAERHGFSRQWIHRMVMKGRLEAVKIGENWYVPENAEIKRSDNKGGRPRKT